MTEKQIPYSQEKTNYNNSMISTVTNSGYLTQNASTKQFQSRAQSPFAPSDVTNSDMFQSHYFNIKKVVTKNKLSPKKQSESPWGQSSATWRHTSYKYSFSKDNRFKQEKNSHLDIMELQIPGCLGNKSCTFGKGRRTPISQLELRNAKFKPSPDRYDLKNYFQQTRQEDLGKTFGVSWQKYKKTYIKHRKDVYSGHFNDQNPPAIYQIRQTPGQNKRKFSMYGRLKMFNKHESDLYRMNPGAVHDIKSLLVKNNRGLNERNFGFGERIDLSKAKNDYPGPDRYLIKGFCQKMQKLEN